MKTKIIIGATSLMAQHVARLWVQEEALTLILVGRDRDKMRAIADDLTIRNPNTQCVLHEVQDFCDPLAIKAWAETLTTLSGIDCVLIAQGALPTQSRCERDLLYCAEMLAINGVSPVLFAEVSAKRLEEQGEGTLAVISSVAADRARKSNYVYGAAKGLLTRYVEGLQHRFAGTKIHVVLIHPGPTQTPMTAHLPLKRLANVEVVAAGIVQAIRDGRQVVYLPKMWRFVMMVITWLPRFIFHRLNV